MVIAEKREHALAVQSLEAESARRKATERHLEDEQATLQRMVGVMDKLSKQEDSSSNLPHRMGLGTLLYEIEHEVKVLRSELQRTTDDLQRTANELQHKQLIIENLWGDNGTQSPTTSGTSFSGSEEGIGSESAESQAASALQEISGRTG